MYRLLRDSQGERFRAIATLGNQSHRTAKAITWLRANYAKPLRVEELAEVARMRMSTLHHHFRALTAMSPMQCQKQLRLVAARERMLINGLDAASAGFEVGYESPSQFNPEYKRFRQPPILDIRARRLGELPLTVSRRALRHTSANVSVTSTELPRRSMRHRACRRTDWESVAENSLTESLLKRR